jgi:esterase/lipase
MKVFVIAGVGDHTGYIKQRTQNWQNKYNLEPIVMDFGWRGNYAKNYTLLKDRVNTLSGEEKVAVIGISAGGSAAIKLASELKNIERVVTICGRTSRGGLKLVSLKSFPAYWESVDNLSRVHLSKELLVIKPWFDEIVSVRHMNYKDAKVLRAPYLLHVPSIFRILSKRSDDIAKFIMQ